MATFVVTIGTTPVVITRQFTKLGGRIDRLDGLVVMLNEWLRTTRQEFGLIKGELLRRGLFSGDDVVLHTLRHTFSQPSSPKLGTA